jgi:hypothetical protein
MATFVLVPGRIHLGPDAQLHQRKPRADLSTKPATLLPKIRAAGTGQPDFQNESLTLLIAGWLRFFTLIQYRGFARYESCGLHRNVLHFPFAFSPDDSLFRPSRSSKARPNLLAPRSIVSAEVLSVTAASSRVAEPAAI